MPRGRAAGYAIMLPKEDQAQLTKKTLREQVIGLLGGRASEELFFHTQSAGASNDFEQATAIARAMITEYGMFEELGTVSYEGNHGIKGSVSGQKTYSGETAAKIDQVLRQFMDQCLEEAKEILTKHSDQVKVIAEHLLELETLNADQIKSLFDTGELPPESEEEDQTNEPTSFEEAKENLKKATTKRRLDSEKSDGNRSTLPKEEGEETSEK